MQYLKYETELRSKVILKIITAVGTKIWKIFNT